MTDEMLSEQLLMTCDWCHRKCASCRKIETDAAIRLQELSKTVYAQQRTIADWKHATGCQTPEDFDAYTAAVRAHNESQDDTRIEVATNSGEAKV